MGTSSLASQRSLCCQERVSNSPNNALENEGTKSIRNVENHSTTPRHTLEDLNPQLSTGNQVGPKAIMDAWRPQKYLAVPEMEPRFLGRPH
jgi:hypothetical protein